MYPSFFSIVLLSATVLGAAQVNAESHSLRFVNNCGFGTPQLVQRGQVMSNGEDFTINGPFESGIAYLQTGPCLLNGEHCALVEMNMNNPACPGCGSSVDISIIPNHALNVETAFSFYGGDGQCDGLGASCADANCNTAYHVPDDNQVVRGCQSDDVNLLITFCGGQGTTYTDAVPNSLSDEPPADSGSSRPPPDTPPAQNNTNNNNDDDAPPPNPSTPATGRSEPPAPSPPPSPQPTGDSSQSPQCVPPRNKRRALRSRASATASDIFKPRAKRMHKRSMTLRGRPVKFGKN